VIDRLSAEARSRELEQIGHEDEGLKVLRALEDEGWMKVLFPAWTVAKADEEKLKALHDLAVELQMQGVHPDMSAAQMQLLTAKLGAKDLAALKKLMLRPGFVEEWNSLDALAAKFAKVLLSKENSTASAGFKLFTSYDPEAVLWLGFTSKDKVVQERFNQFLKVWPEARQRTPHALMQELRITPELPAYKDIVQAIFLELIDGKLATPEDMRTFLEPHSPPAPPPQVTVKRPRAKRGEAKVKERTYDDDEEPEDALDEDEDLDDLGGDDDEIDLGMNLPKVDLDLEPEPELGEEIEAESAEDDLEADDHDAQPAAGKRGAKPGKNQAQSKKVSAKVDAPEMKAKAVSAAVSAKPAVPPVNMTAKNPPPRKEDKTAKAGSAVAPGMKPTQSLSGNVTAGVKPPQVVAKGTLVPGAKPPQIKAGALAPAVAKPAHGVKTNPPAAKPAKAVAAKAKSAPNPAKKVQPAKAAAKKATPAKKVDKKADKKGKPAKATKKAAPAKKPKPAAKNKKR